MTTDFIQQKEAGRKARFSLLPKALRKQGADICKNGLELTRQENFVEGEQDIFDLLERHKLEKEGLKRSMSSAMTILNNAHLMIERAEQTIARQSGHIRKLENMATTDELTGLLNRRGFFRAFVREIARTGRGHGNGGLLILIDVNNFRSVNERYGQDAGDACLKLVARALENEVRAMDAGARLGGDEFVLLLPGAHREQTLDRAQRLGFRLNNLSFIWRGAEIRINISLGLQSYGPDDKAEDIFRQADQKLQARKRQQGDAKDMP